MNDKRNFFIDFVHSLEQWFHVQLDKKMKAHNRNATNLITRTSENISVLLTTLCLLYYSNLSYVSSFFFSVLYSSNSFCKSLRASLVSSMPDLSGVCVNELDMSREGSIPDKGIY